jgi:hypothetical protein
MSSVYPSSLRGPRDEQARSRDQASSLIPLLLLLDAEVTLMPLLALWTSVQMPKATSARMMKSTMMMMAMTSFFLTIVKCEGGTPRPGIAQVMVVVVGEGPGRSGRETAPV